LNDVNEADVGRDSILNDAAGHDAEPEVRGVDAASDVIR